MASFIGEVQVHNALRYCYRDSSKYYYMRYYAALYADVSTAADNSVTYTNMSVRWRRDSADYGYLSYCPSEDGKCVGGCCTDLSVYTATNLSGSYTKIGSYTTYRYWASSSNLSTMSMSGSFTLKPGEQMSLPLGKVEACTTTWATLVIKNNNSKPVDTAPSVSVTCSGSTTSGSFSVGGSYGSCNGSTSGSTSWTLTSGSSTIKSGSGTSGSFTGLNPNTRYTVSATRSNGCYSRTASCSFVTCIPNALSEPTALNWNTGRVRLSVTNGGGYNTPSTQIQYKKCTASSWTNGPTSKTTTIATIEIPNLEDNTCYQVRAITTAGSCSYTSNTVTFTTPKRCVQAYIADQNITMNEKTYQVDNTIKVHYTAFSSPFTIWLQYRVKNGYSSEWEETKQITISDALVSGSLEGDLEFKIENLFQNLVEYEVRIKAVAPQDSCDFTGDIAEFVTPLMPEPEPPQICETLTYLSELVCQATKKLYDGNITILANPATVAKCDPYNELPTHLTLWTRLLRFFHAMNCLMCGMVETQLAAGSEHQYWVGEIGWIDFLDKVVSDEDSESWRLVTSAAVKAYINSQLHSVWHSHGRVDYMVATVAERNKLPDNAESCIVTDLDKVYVKKNGNWVEAEEQPDDFAVYHINSNSTAWYFWDGTWNRMDANVTEIEALVEKLEAQGLSNVVSSPQVNQRIKVVDKDYDIEAEAADNHNTTYFVTEPADLPAPLYRTVTVIGKDSEVIDELQVIDGKRMFDYEYLGYDGYNFDHWSYLDGTPFEMDSVITSDITIYGHWTPKPLTVVFEIGEAIGNTPAPASTVFGGTITVPGPSGLSYPGRNFLGWATAAGTIWQNDYPVYNNMTLYPLWEADSLVVTFNYGDTTVTTPIEYGGYIVEPPVVEKEGFTFIGWFGPDGEPFDFSQPITASIIITAKYVSNTVRVTFNAQTSPDVTADDPATQTLNRGARATDPALESGDYIVVYWTLNGERYNFDLPVESDITLEAVWRKFYLVEFDSNGGTPVEAQKVVEGDFAKYPENPTKEGCEFLGWEEVEYYTVKFDPANGDETFEQEVAGGEKAIKPDDPTPPCENGTFEGWKEKE